MLDCPDPWDDSLLIKAYDDSINLAREELARRIALSTSKGISSSSSRNIKDSNIEVIKKLQYNVGDYVRATYEDGIDYEAKILEVDHNTGSCLLKYIGYENVQKIPLYNLIPSWGKRARRLQFAKAKLDNTEQISETNTSRRNKSTNIKTIPPPPPMPPMLSAAQNSEESDHLSAMLMSWYMSGYYTGIYQGIRMTKTTSKKKN